MATQIEIGTEHGLRKVARLINIEINDDQKFIAVHYRELLLAEDDAIVNKGKIQSYKLVDAPAVEREGEVIVPASTAYSDWDAQLGDVIRPAVIARLQTIYNIS